MNLEAPDAGRVKTQPLLISPLNEAFPFAFGFLNSGS